MERIAVYGTLKKPYGNHKIIEGQKFVGEDMVEFSAMISSGFPMAKFEEGTGKWLKVEIYDVDMEAFRRCDALEGNGSFYIRKKVKTKNGLEAWIYEIMRNIQDNSDEFQVAEGIYSWSR